MCEIEAGSKNFQDVWNEESILDRLWFRIHTETRRPSTYRNYCTLNRYCSLASKSMVRLSIWLQHFKNPNITCIHCLKLAEPQRLRLPRVQPLLESPQLLKRIERDTRVMWHHGNNWDTRPMWIQAIRRIVIHKINGHWIKFMSSRNVNSVSVLPDGFWYFFFFWNQHVVHWRLSNLKNKFHVTYICFTTFIRSFEVFFKWCL